MNIETLGHAGLLIRDDQNEPVLFTDPWISGSCYWRSWWLQNYPDQAAIDELRRVRYCFVTHEHPDHFHTASIRLLGKGPEFLSPDLPQEHITAYLSAQGYRAAVLPAFEWRQLHPDVRILSIPLFNDDSVLVIETPRAVLINMNDAKPRRRQLRQLCRALDAVAPGKTRVLLSSYSPASIVNSFIRRAERVSLRRKSDYVRYICGNCRLLRADYYMPFASQVIFKRSDSTWANEFRVSFGDLESGWDAGQTRLLPPFTRLNLADGSFTSVPEERYLHDEEPVLRKVHAQEALDAAARLDAGDLQRLERKLNHARWLFALLFPRGIGFSLEGRELHYSPWKGTLREGGSSGDFVLQVPSQAFKEALEYGHFGDMGTTMFTIVILNSGIHPRRVYLFFMLMSLNDYGHTTTLRNVLRWVWRSLRIHSWRIPDGSSHAGAVGR